MYFKGNINKKKLMLPRSCGHCAPTMLHCDDMMTRYIVTRLFQDLSCHLSSNMTFVKRSQCVWCVPLILPLPRPSDSLHRIFFSLLYYMGFGGGGVQKKNEKVRKKYNNSCPSGYTATREERSSSEWPFRFFFIEGVEKYRSICVLTAWAVQSITSR